MKVSNTIFASVLALTAVLGAPSFAGDIAAFRPVEDAAPIPAAIPVTIPAAATAPTPILAAAEAPAEAPVIPVLGTAVVVVTEPAVKADAVVVPVVEDVTLPAMEPAKEPVKEPSTAPVIDTAEVAPPALPPALPVAEVTPPPLPQLPPYFVGVDGQAVGPLDEAALRDLAAKGKLTEASLVWTEGMGDWEKAADVAEIEAILQPGPKGLGVKADDAKVAPAPAPAPEPVVINASTVLPGAWQIDGPMPVDGLGMGDADMVIVFNPDGTYQSSGTITAVVGNLSPYPVEIVIDTVGQWQLQDNGDGTANVVVKATTYLSIPELGVPTQANAGYDSFVVQVVDGNTVVADGTEWVRIDA